MRLIDADALAEQVDNLCADWNENWIGNDNQSFILHGDVSDIISDAPTIEAEPVRHGRWVLVSQWRDEEGTLNPIYRCTACSITNDEEDRYCPHCGAKMDKEG